MISLDQC